MENSKKRSAGPRRATLEKPRRAGTAIVTDPWIIDYETGQPRHPCLEDLRRNTIVAEQLEPVVSISRMDYPVTDVPGPESSLRALEMHLLHHTRHYQVMAASLDSFDQWLGLAEVLGRGGDLSRLITSAVAAGSPLVLNELSFSNQWFPLAGGARVQFVPKGPPAETSSTPCTATRSATATPRLSSPAPTGSWCSTRTSSTAIMAWLSRPRSFGLIIRNAGWAAGPWISAATRSGLTSSG
ncbi:MAG: hypothetical protein MUE50_12535 [Pirellulaceae bacterium]|jgi:hypothetical protein|nr:hypothetical protein [Pirellulaceae bacterium]